MKAPLSWLKDFVDIDCTPEQLKDKLFSCGFEVEDMTYLAKQIDRIVVCKVLSIEKHPDADKLSVVQVDAGEHGNLQIVTAATNLFVGALVPVALDNSTLFSGDKIKTGKLRGVTSYGMFCSGQELGIGDDWYEGASVNGILILKEDYPLGMCIKKALQLEDVMFDINITANRPDCQSIFGIAREVAAVLNKPLKMPDLEYKICSDLSTKNTIKVENKAYDLCPRYSAQMVSDIKISPSPLWLKRRLFLMGLRSINNIVDITNYVLLEIGQPMHAFDLNDLSQSTIIIRRADDGEKITTLDEKEFSLSNNNLVICDAVKPVAIAGVMGGLNSEIKEQTKNIVFESAKFARDSIRKTSKQLGQRTDASSRYEKGVDFYSVELGLNRALNLISTLNCGKISCDKYDLYEGELKEKEIITNIDKVNSVLGIEVPKEDILDILRRLNFTANISENGQLSVKVPLYREDMDDYPDIAEEIIREYGYDKITPTLLKTCSITSGGLNLVQNAHEQFKNLLVGYGFNEIITYSFVSEKEYDLFGFDKESDEYRFIRLLNPLGEDLAVMRTSLLPSAVKKACYNLNRKNYEGRLFELAKVYNAKELPLNQLPVENEVLSLVMFGEQEDFFTLKGVVEGLVNTFCADKKVQFTKANMACLHPTRGANLIVDGINVGYLGQIHPNIIEKLDADKPVYACEIQYSKLEKLFTDKIVAKAVSKFPTVERDLAVIVDKKIAWADIQEIIKRASGKYLDSIKLFDIYESEQIGFDKKSMAFNLVFVAEDRTLNVEEVDSIIKKILKSLSYQLGAELR